MVSPPRSVAVRSPGPASTSRHQTFYAVVLHDFVAERTDELDAKAGDPITVVAQSNEEWFVAKPIGRLGRPGLIPASFVELRDPATNTPIPDLSGIMVRGELPKVEDWKRAMHEYKQSSISLGVLDNKSTSPTSHPISPPIPKSTYGLYTPPPIPNRAPAPMEPLPEDRPPTPVSMQDPNLLPPGILLSAEVVDFHFENDEYWFRINAIYLPEDQSSFTTPARQLVLFRVYDDFYDFQIALLDAFPVEAGRENGPPSPQSEGGPTETEPSRILPYMPGPVPQVDDVVTSLRRKELDEYLRQLCALREINADHVLRHTLVRSFFSPKPGDVETAIPPSQLVDSPLTLSQRVQEQDEYDDYEEVRDGVGTLSLGKNRSRLSDDARYEEDYGRSNDYESRPTQRVASQNGYYAHGRTGSSASLALSHNDSPRPSPREGTNQSYSSTTSVPFSDSGQSASPSSRQTTYLSSNPSISATNPQTAFLKIKIFHRQTDDLIAIRVNPRVSHIQLMEKVRERLGDEVQAVSYRNSLTGGFSDLQDDFSLREWLNHADKHVLYAS